MPENPAIDIDYEDQIIEIYGLRWTFALLHAISEGIPINQPFVIKKRGKIGGKKTVYIERIEVKKWKKKKEENTRPTS